MRLDAYGLFAISIIVAPAAATVALALNWSRWQAPIVTKVLATIALYVFVIPASCLILAMAGEASGLLAPFHP